MFSRVTSNIYIKYTGGRVGKTLEAMSFVPVSAHFSKVDSIYLKKKSPMHF